MQNKKVIVTGGAGFIGSNLAKRLSRENNEVIIIDDLSTGSYDNIEQMDKNGEIKFLKGTITDLKFLKKAFKDVDYVFHQAAIPSVQKSIRDPININKTNINGTLNVLIASKENKIKKVVLASSSSIYGDTPNFPIKENFLPNPLSPYAVTKLAGEYYCKVFTEVYGMSTVSLRYFNVYGPGQNISSEYSAVIPNFINRISNKKSPYIYGNGKQTRDFVFVDDVVNANILAMEKKVNGIFNIGNEKSVTINDLARIIMRIYGYELDIKYSDTRPGDIKFSIADISKAKEKINYDPKFNLEDGLKNTIKFFKDKKYRSTK